MLLPVLHVYCFSWMIKKKVFKILPLISNIQYHKQRNKRKFRIWLFQRKEKSSLLLCAASIVGAHVHTCTRA